MLQQAKHTQIQFYLFGALVFSLPVYYPSSSLILILLTLNFLASGNWAEKWARLVASKLSWVFIFCYFVLMLGLAITSNKSVGYFDLETKLPMLVAPLVILTTRFTVIQIRTLGKLFIAGSIVSMLFFFALSVYNFLLSGDYNTFFYAKLSHWIHPGYYSIYLNFVLAILVRYLTLNWLEISRQKKLIIGALIVFVAVFVFMLLAKVGVLILFGIMFWGLAYLTIKHKRWKVSVVFLILIFGLNTMIIRVNDLPKRRLEAFYTELIQSDNSSIANSSNRSVLWEASLGVIEKNWLTGVGAGDGIDELVKEYDRRGMEKAARKRLNSHNQLIQSLLDSGIFGGIATLLLFLVPAWQSVKIKNTLNLMFLFSFGTFCIIESAFETQAGIVFFTCISLLFYEHPIKIKDALKENKDNFTR